MYTKFFTRYTRNKPSPNPPNLTVRCYNLCAPVPLWFKPSNAAVILCALCAFVFQCNVLILVDTF